MDKLLVDPNSAKELGKILGVDSIVSGTIADRGDTLRVNARLISTETAEVFSVAAVTIWKDSAKAPIGRAASEEEQTWQGLCEQLTKTYRGANPAKKPTIAVLEFSSFSGLVSDLGRLISEELITKLFSTGEFKVIERFLLNKAIAEHKLQVQGLVDPKSAKELGKILGVDAIVSGTIADLGETFRVHARLISTETGEVFAVAAAPILKDGAINALMTGSGKATGFGKGTTTKQAVSEPDGTGIKITVERAVKNQGEIELTITIKNETDNERYLWVDRTLAMAGDVSLLSNSGKKWLITTATNFNIEMDTTGGYLGGGGYSSKARTKFSGLGRYAPGEAKQQKLTFANSDDSNGEEFEFRGTLRSIDKDPFWIGFMTYHFTDVNSTKGVSKIIKGIRPTPKTERPKRK